MMKNWEIKGTEEIGLVTPTPGSLQGAFERLSLRHVSFEVK